MSRFAKRSANSLTRTRKVAPDADERIRPAFGRIFQRGSAEFVMADEMRQEFFTHPTENGHSFFSTIQTRSKPRRFCPCQCGTPLINDQIASCRGGPSGGASALDNGAARVSGTIRYTRFF